MNNQSPEAKESIARVFKTLGDPSRLEIVTSIGKAARSVTEIVQSTGLSQTLVSFHLRILREAGIVTTRRNGPFILYSLSDQSLLALLTKLSQRVNGKKLSIENTGEPSSSRKAKLTTRRKS